jgi:uncharacterized membrane protein YhhN
MLTMTLSALAGLSAICDIRADLRRRRRSVYLFKPLTMVWVILIALLPPHGATATYRALIIAGLLCSLIGDVLLMLPQDRFLGGLGAFVCAHLLYIVAFGLQAKGLGPWYVAIPFIICLGMVTRLLWPHLGDLRIPVLAYEMVILAMAWRAWVCWASLGTGRTLLAAIGATMFMASDLLLAYNRFLRPLRRGPIWIMSAYFAAQWLIALSA